MRGMPSSDVLAQEWLHPLPVCYRADARVLPAAEEIDAAAIPEPYRRLLVHDNDMTPTLEAYHASSIHVEVLRMSREKSQYTREVLLRLDRGDQPVQYGASQTHLERFPDEAAALVLRGRTPLGTIMAGWSIRHRCFPYRFLRVHPTPQLTGWFGLAEERPLYGRQNRITDAGGAPLMDVIEVLAP